MRERVALVLTATALAAWSAATPAAIPDPVTVETGRLSGMTLKSGVRAFKGIPFAAPPLGPLRWKEPLPVRPWTGVKQAVEFGDSCMQSYDFGPMSEDCLTLNVWAEWPSREATPVMVWFHGGGDSSGGTNSIGFMGDSLARRGVVVVTVN